jgi:hypothetical protein
MWGLIVIRDKSLLTGSEAVNRFITPAGIINGSLTGAIGSPQINVVIVPITTSRIRRSGSLSLKYILNTDWSLCSMGVGP